MFRNIKREIKLNILQPYWNFKANFIYYGQKVFFPRNSIIFRRTIVEGIFESSILGIANALIRPNTDVFDIGANIGIMAIPLLHNHDSINVISVEASPNTLPYLKKTHAANKSNARWTIIDKAVSDTEGKINFQLANAADGAYDSINDTKRTQFTRSVEVDCTTIDIIWRSRNCPAVSFIKIDIEGADLLALKGGLECIKTCKPPILLEWNSINIKAFDLVNQDLLSFFQSLNYNCFTTPGLIKVKTLKDLELHSNFTENFLLMPA